MEGMQVGIYYENRFNISEFGVKSAAFAMNTKPGTFAVNFTSFGYNRFSDNKFGLAYSMKLAEYIAVGVQVDYIYIIQDSYYGNINTITGEIGILANPFDDFYVGVHVFNPWRSKVAEHQDERLPTIFRLGCAYDFSPAVKFTTEVEKDLEYPVYYKFGLQYFIIEQLPLRVGASFSEKNTFLNFGIGYHMQNILIDIGFESHSMLGFKSGVSVIYRFR
jgi:hypothetical protein